ncbi:MTMRB protein, partial [Nothoprocta pentlandii]|nr:MTMRB protein [Nothoprocta pentlandii]
AACSFAKPKVLTAASSLKFIPEELAVHCRDFRLLRFHFHESGLQPQAFRVSPGGEGGSGEVLPAFPPPAALLQVAMAIAQAREAATWPGHADGEDEEEEEEEDEEEEEGPTPLFESLHDWEKELKRQGAVGWRVSAVNERFDMATSLPRYLWVPSRLLDKDLKRVFAHFEERRVPRLCWHHPGGSNLLRTAGFHAASEPQREDVRRARWLRCWPRDAAPSCCKVTLAAARGGSTDPTGRPQRPPRRPAEPHDRDFNCLLASLAQLLADPHARTLPGFQSLVQREWVAAGHPFARRLGLGRPSPRDEAPVFLLFLDCTWQLVRQFPGCFGFTESYLLALHDSSFVPYFSTFLFNCQWQRGRNSRVSGGRGSCRTPGPHLIPPEPGAVLQPPGSAQSYTPVSGWREPAAAGGAQQGGSPPGRCRRPLSVWDWRLRYSRQQRSHFRNPAGPRAGPAAPGP